MTKFKFTQVDWKPFVLLPLISNLLFKFLQGYFEKGMAMLLCILIVGISLFLSEDILVRLSCSKILFCFLKRVYLAKKLKCTMLIYKAYPLLITPI